MDFEPIIPKFDQDHAAFRRRGDATAFIAELLKEVELPEKAAFVDKDGHWFRVYIVIISSYWEPRAPELGAWAEELRRVKERVANARA